ncbi:MAG: AraC family transcriptional regulator [Novosphingobium sp.]
MPKTHVLQQRAIIPQIRTMTLAHYVDVARRIGVDPYALLKQSGIRADFLDEPDNLLAASAAMRLVEDTAAAARCEAFGLLLAEGATNASLGPVGLLLQVEPTVRGAVGALARYQKLCNDVLSFDLDEGSELPIIQLNMAPGFASRQLIETILAQTVQALRSISGDRWQPDAIHLRHAAPAHPTVHRRIFRCPVEFDAAFDGIVCAPGALEIPNPQGNADLAAHARKYLDILSAGQKAASATDRVRQAINKLIGSGAITRNKVAGVLAIHPRMLQRMLEHEGTNFAVLLNECRRELAHRYITTSSKCLLEISELLGYANASSFSRWFSREFGVTPMTLRNERFRKGLMDRQEAARHVTYCSTNRCGLEATNDA